MKIKIILTIILLFYWMDGYSCKCSDLPKIQDSYEKASVVIYGKIVSKELVSYAETMRKEKANEIRNRLKNNTQKLQFFESDLIFEIKLKVIESYKNNVGELMTIYTPIKAASCGYKFEVDKDYIVYASKKSFAYIFFLEKTEREDDVEKENTYWTSHCTRTKGYDELEVYELRKLNN